MSTEKSSIGNSDPTTPELLESFFRQLGEHDPGAVANTIVSTGRRVTTSLHDYPSTAEKILKGTAGPFLEARDVLKAETRKLFKGRLKDKQELSPEMEAATTVIIQGFDEIIFGIRFFDKTLRDELITMLGRVPAESLAYHTRSAFKVVTENSSNEGVQRELEGKSPIWRELMWAVYRQKEADLQAITTKDPQAQDAEAHRIKTRSNGSNIAILCLAAACERPIIYDKVGDSGKGDKPRSQEHSIFSNTAGDWGTSVMEKGYPAAIREGVSPQENGLEDIAPLARLRLRLIAAKKEEILNNKDLSEDKRALIIKSFGIGCNAFLLTLAEGNNELKGALVNMDSTMLERLATQAVEKATRLSMSVDPEAGIMNIAPTEEVLSPPVSPKPAFRKKYPGLASIYLELEIRANDYKNKFSKWNEKPLALVAFKNGYRAAFLAILSYLEDDISPHQEQAAT
jgi:hypothetical protein